MDYQYGRDVQDIAWDLYQACLVFPSAHLCFYIQSRHEITESVGEYDSAAEVSYRLDKFIDVASQRESKNIDAIIERLGQELEAFNRGEY